MRATPVGAKAVEGGDAPPLVAALASSDTHGWDYSWPDHMSHAGLTVAEETRRRFVAQATRLREQEGNRRAAAGGLGWNPIRYNAGTTSCRGWDGQLMASA
jgi:hypothetical protein